MTEEIKAQFAAWWSVEGRYLPPDTSPEELALRAFAGGWWKAAQLGVEGRSRA